MTLMELAISLQLLPSVLASAQWHFIGPMAVAAGLAMPVGAYALVNTDQQLLARAIAAIVLGFVLLVFAGWRYQGPSGYRSP